MLGLFVGGVLVKGCEDMVGAGEELMKMYCREVCEHQCSVEEVCDTYVEECGGWC